jgi:hypothetical protein
MNQGQIDAVQQDWIARIDPANMDANVKAVHDFFDAYYAAQAKRTAP